MVHSSLKSFGRVEGGARTVIAALMEVITPEGTLLFPSFNHGRAFEEGQPGYFDPRETPTTNGAIPDLFWRMPGVLRSLAPTHAFAAWGKNARRYMQFHHRTLTMGPESPLGTPLEGRRLRPSPRRRVRDQYVSPRGGDDGRLAVPGSADGGVSGEAARRPQRDGPHLGLARRELPVHPAAAGTAARCAPAGWTGCG